MTGPRKSAALAGLLVYLLLAGPDRADALDLNGAWASDADLCVKVFVRQGERLGFTEMSDVYGGGFIIDGDQIIGKFARCRIKARKDDGMNVNLIAACATDIMLSSVQFSLKQLDADSVARLCPGIEGMEIRYHRCSSR
jgi:hypothetical protein